MCCYYRIELGPTNNGRWFGGLSMYMGFLWGGLEEQEDMPMLSIYEENQNLDKICI